MRRLSQDLAANETAHQAARFLGVGILNTLFGYGLFYVLLSATGRTTLSLALATCCGVMFNFATTGRLVFGGSTGGQLLRFIGVYVVIFVINAVALAVLEGFGLSPAIGQAMLVMPLAALSFVLNKILVFGDAR